MDPATAASIATQLANAGPQAIFVALCMALLWFARSAYQREVARADAATAEVAALTTVIRDGLAANAAAVRDGSSDVATELKALRDEIRWSGRDRPVRRGQPDAAP